MKCREMIQINRRPVDIYLICWETEKFHFSGDNRKECWSTGISECYHIEDVGHIHELVCLMTEITCLGFDLTTYGAELRKSKFHFRAVYVRRRSADPRPQTHRGSHFQAFRTQNVGQGECTVFVATLHPLSLPVVPYRGLAWLIRLPLRRLALLELRNRWRNTCFCIRILVMCTESGVEMNCLDMQHTVKIKAKVTMCPTLQLGVQEMWRWSPRILGHRTRWRWVVSVMLHALYLPAHTVRDAECIQEPIWKRWWS
jgi:hypothetical protein